MVVQCSICEVFYRDGKEVSEESLTQGEVVKVQICNHCYNKWVVGINKQIGGEK